MELKSTLSPNQFKALYSDPMIASVKLRMKRTAAHVPITFAEVIDITGDLVVYYYHDGFRTWTLVGVEE